MSTPFWMTAAPSSPGASLSRRRDDRARIGCRRHASLVTAKQPRLGGERQADHRRARARPRGHVHRERIHQVEVTMSRAGLRHVWRHAREVDVDRVGALANLVVHGPAHGALQVEPHLHRKVRAGVAQVLEGPESAPNGTVLAVPAFDRRCRLSGEANEGHVCVSSEPLGEVVVAKLVSAVGWKGSREARIGRACLGPSWSGG